MAIVIDSEPVLTASDVERARALAESAARLVGARLREHFRGDHEELEISYKGVSDIVTEVDLWSEEKISQCIQAMFPDHCIIGEETSSQLSYEEIASVIQNRVCWLVDPIDGTSNFANGLPHFGVSIALVDHGVPLCGVVYDPIMDELFSAIRGQGAFLNLNPIVPGKKEKLIECVVATGFPSDRRSRWQDYRPVVNSLVLSCRTVRSLGSATLDACWVACGRLDAQFQFRLRPWDVAAASLIVEEAGGLGYSYHGHSTGHRYSLVADAFLHAGSGLGAKFDELIRESMTPVS